MIIKLESPLNYCGNELTEINLKLEDMKGRDLLYGELDARRMAASYDKTGNFQLWGTQHILTLASRASGILESSLEELSAKDFMKIQMAVINFFSDVISTVSEPESSEVPF